MPSYIVINDSEVEPEAPLLSSLGVRFRDNPIAIAQREAGAPAMIALRGDTVTAYDTAGSTSLVVPDAIGIAYAIMIGGGGGGGGTNDTGDSGGGGGGGAFVYAALKVTPGETLTSTVGAGGTQGQNEDGGNGGASSVAGAAGTISAPGGVGGLKDGNGGTGGAGGSASVGSGILVTSGENGEDGVDGTYGGAGGDGGWDGASTRNPYYGEGAPRQTTGDADGINGSAVGGGGSGSLGNDYTGGNGARGLVILIY